MTKEELNEQKEKLINKLNCFLRGTLQPIALEAIKDCVEDRFDVMRRMLFPCTTYRVHYPLITMDTYDDFDNKEDAEKFANERRNITSCSPYGNMQMASMIRVEEIKVDKVKQWGKI